ncbi:MAG: PP0621 family protein [Thiohalomonadaceae bacterium]
MNLIRLLVIAAVVWLAYVLFKRWLAEKQPPRPEGEQRRQERMVKCAYCGVHVPESQALHRGNQSYCSPEHRDAHHP